MGERTVERATPVCCRTCRSQAERCVTMPGSTEIKDKNPGSAATHAGEIVARQRAWCATCGGTTCINPSFYALCRDADDRKAHDAAPRRVDPSLWRRIPEHIPHNWDEMSLESLMAHFERARRGHGAPQTTVEALMFA